MRKFSYIARVKNSSGIHGVFYGGTRPKKGSECPGIAKPNKVIGYRLEPIPGLSK